MKTSMSELNLTTFMATNDFEIGLYLHICNYRPVKVS